VVNLTADPALGWKVESWSGTDNDQTESLQNTATMPSADHLVEVHYVPLAHKSFLPIVIK